MHTLDSGGGSLVILFHLADDVFDISNIEIGEGFQFVFAVTGNRFETGAFEVRARVIRLRLFAHVEKAQREVRVQETRLLDKRIGEIALEENSAVETAFLDGAQGEIGCFPLGTREIAARETAVLPDRT